VAAVLARCEPPVRLTDMAAAVRDAARLLGNTPAVCRKSYVHPAIIEAFSRGETIGALRETTPGATGSWCRSIPPSICIPSGRMAGAARRSMRAPAAMM